MAQTKMLFVKPCQSLKNLRHLLSPELEFYYRRINNLLERKAEGLSPREIIFTQLPMKLRSVNYIYTPRFKRNELTLEQAYIECKRVGLDPAPIPYLWGILEGYSLEAYRELSDFQYIESLYWPDIFSFKHRFGGERSLQICLKRKGEGVSAGISDFVSDGIISPMRIVAPTSVKIVSFVPETKEETKDSQSSHLFGKMIG